MTIRDKKLEIIRNHAANSFVLQIHREQQVNGQWWPIDPVALDVDSPEFGEFAEAFSAHVVARVNVLDSLCNAFATQRDEAVEARDAALAQLAEKDAKISGLEASVTELRKLIPWDSRVLEAAAFLARISGPEMLMLVSSTDQNVQGILGMLQQWSANDWRVELDSPEITQAVGYLVQAGLVSSSRVAELLRDCTREEAFVADGVSRASAADTQ